MNRTLSWIKLILSTWVVGLFAALMTSPAWAGAVSTTTNPAYAGFGGGAGHCLNGNEDPVYGVVNCNIYDSKQNVWMSGLPVSATLPAGRYFFAVVEPGGKVNSGPVGANDCQSTKNLSDVAPCDTSNTGANGDWTHRVFDLAADGTITYPPTGYLGGHEFDPSLNRINLYGYDDTTNNGGEYQMVVCKLPTDNFLPADVTLTDTPPGVDDSACAKSDNFKVIQANPEKFSILACKFDDQNGDGLRAGDPLLPNWKITADYGSGSQVDKITDDTGCVPTVFEVDPSRTDPVTLFEFLQDGWYQTAPFDTGTYTGYTGTAAGYAVVSPPFTAGGSVTVYFGNTNFKEGGALQIAKDATPAESFSWSIAKSVDKTTVKQVGGSATFNYTATVTLTSSSWTLTGNITISNSSVAGVTGLKIVDTIDNGGSCTIDTGGNGTANTVGQIVTVTGVNLAGGGSQVMTYSCSFVPAPTALSGTNTVQLYLSDDTLIDDSSADYTFATPPTLTITDTFNGGTPVTLGTIAYPYPSSKSYNYSQTIPIPADGCLSYTNVAAITGGPSDSKTVTVCGPAKTGALTIGFWKTTNGQNLIKTYCVNGANNLGSYLAGLGGGSGPFSNAPTTCSSLATYVYNILNGASATDMNKMLKAQMLGTALDVWFSGPGWTSTAIGSIKQPSKFLSNNNLGTFKMDTTAVCPMVDNTSTGVATCLNNTPSTDAVAAGAVPSSPMAMQAILDFASTTPSPFNGSTSSSVWYGGNRTLQEILKNIFDQFNNQMAFGSF